MRRKWLQRQRSRPRRQAGHAEVTVRITGGVGKGIDAKVVSKAYATT
jgi:hypothetical protein